MRGPQDRKEFLNLNPDILSFLIPYLSWSTLESLSIASKESFNQFGVASRSRVSIEGTEPLLNFCDSFKNDSSHCPCKPLPNQNQTKTETTKGGNQEIKLEDFKITLNSEQESFIQVENSSNGTSIQQKKSNLKTHIKHLELVEPGPIKGGIGEKEEIRLQNLLRKLESFADSNNGGMIASATSLCPELRTLKVLQTPLPFTLPLAASLISTCPKLEELTYRTPHLDASALALTICNLPNLSLLDISGARSCWCRGQIGRIQAMKELTSSFSRCKKLKRIVMTSCKVLSVNDDHDGNNDKEKVVNLDLLSLLGKASRENVSICSHGFPLKDRSSSSSLDQLDPRSSLGWNTLDFCLSLSSLEIRRSSINGKSLAFFLSSPCCKNLSHLFIGGCKKVGKSHLIEAFPNSASYSSSLELELDGYLISEELLKRVSSRLSVLRVFQPSSNCLSILNKILLNGYLSKLLSLIIIPTEESLSQWDFSTSSSQVNTFAKIETETKIDPQLISKETEKNTDVNLVSNSKTRKNNPKVSSVTPSDFIKTLKEKSPKTEVRIGDENWFKMREAIAERKWWAEKFKEEKIEKERIESQNWEGGLDVF